jgi:hypothetical protein
LEQSDDTGVSPLLKVSLVAACTLRNLREEYNSQMPRSLF